jgi:uncharacterized protein YjbJ (UPF0337 family)
MSQTSDGPQRLQAKIEQTRADLGETMEALTAKLDVSGRAKDAAGDVADVASRRLHGASQHVPQAVGDVGQQFRSAAASARDSLSDVDLATLRKPRPVVALAAMVAAVGVVIFLIRRLRG